MCCRDGESHNDCKWQPGRNWVKGCADMTSLVYYMFVWGQFESQQLINWWCHIKYRATVQALFNYPLKVSYSTHYATTAPTSPKRKMHKLWFSNIQALTASCLQSGRPITGNTSCVGWREDKTFPLANMTKVSWYAYCAPYLSFFFTVVARLLVSEYCSATWSTIVNDMHQTLCWPLLNIKVQYTVVWKGRQHSFYEKLCCPN